MEGLLSHNPTPIEAVENPNPLPPSASHHPAPVDESTAMPVDESTIDESYCGDAIVNIWLTLLHEKYMTSALENAVEGEDPHTQAQALRYYHLPEPIYYVATSCRTRRRKSEATKYVSAASAAKELSARSGVGRSGKAQDGRK
ncbi:hypothetical protein BC936DRAFT_140370 [Jimgerdemannia flammicorona]|uniref:Uncharacterized protein n=1 Tax=Jimgerdemannia flammicorona TaxID=994334 RepID=A0A433AUG5_9FUNG|nr:hypothetical protein BC936DRAFT_140370 [Jimgerdemannia flammicorona]